MILTGLEIQRRIERGEIVIDPFDAALVTAGLRDDLQARAATGTDLARKFLAKATAPGRVLLPGPLRRLTEPTASLQDAGFEVRELALYETLPVAAGNLPALDFNPGDIVFFCSPSAG